MAKHNDNGSIVALDRFIEATRDSGYKGTVNAVAELVDNSLQAGAKDVHVQLRISPEQDDYRIQLIVTDDGCGMDRGVLRQALRFGGTTRFNDRRGLGRYGMGLPNASLSQARRVEVFTWQNSKRPIFSYLDVDEIIEGRLQQIPAPRSRCLPSSVSQLSKASGTVVLWTKCDRLDHRRASTLARKLHTFLGRMFRYFLWNGVTITIDDRPVEPIDPLYVAESSKTRGGQLFQEPMTFEVRAGMNNGKASSVGQVVVRFSELPVHEWHSLPRDEKRRLGVSNGAGVSVVRAGREIDYGWFFMGGKRRENYDDWWRCEVKFDPILDEAFGITHTKQQIRPGEFLQEVLDPELEVIAKALNARVRQQHAELKTGRQTVVAESLASERDEELSPLPRVRVDADSRKLMTQLEKRHPRLRMESLPDSGVEYRLVEDEAVDTCFYRPVIENGRIVVLVNRRHDFFRRWYSTFAELESGPGRDAAHLLQVLLLSAARAEATATRKSDRNAVKAFRQSWSDALNVFLRK